MPKESENSRTLTVKNESETTKTIVAGCQSNGEVLFDEGNEIPSGARTEFTGIPDASFELAINVEDGPQSSQRYQSDSDVDEITVTVTESEIDFRPENTSLSAFKQSSTGNGATSQSRGETDERAPDSDEVYCRNCGEIISKHAKICTECGVQNAAYEPAPDPEPAEPAVEPTPDTAVESGDGGADRGSRSEAADTSAGTQSAEGGAQDPTAAEMDAQAADSTTAKRRWTYLLAGVVLTVVSVVVPVFAGVLLTNSGLVPVAALLNIVGIVLILFGIYRIIRY